MQTNKDTLVTVKLEDVRNSYDKMVERKILLIYVDSLENQLSVLKERLALLNSEFGEQKELQEQLLKAKDDKYETLEKLVKVRKLQFISGFGAQTNTKLNLIQMNLNTGLMFKQKRMVILNVGMDNNKNFLVGGQFLTVF